MNWDEIEVKWTEMARRVRADAPLGHANGPEEDPPTIPPGDLPDPTPAKAGAESSLNSGAKTRTKVDA